MTSRALLLRACELYTASRASFPLLSRAFYSFDLGSSQSVVSNLNRFGSSNQNDVNLPSSTSWPFWFDDGRMFSHEFEFRCISQLAGDKQNVERLAHHMGTNVSFSTNLRSAGGHVLCTCFQNPRSGTNRTYFEHKQRAHSPSFSVSFFRVFREFSIFFT